MYTGCLVEEDVYLEMKNSWASFQPLCLSLDSWYVLISLCLRKWRVDVIVCLEDWRLETGVLLDVMLAHSFVLYSSSHSRGLASGAIWLSCTLRRYWCLAIKYCICWEVAKAPAARRRWETEITLGHSYTQLLLFPYARVCVFVHIPAVFQCGSVFYLSISHLSGWQFKTTK